MLEGLKDLNTLRSYHIRLTADGEVLDGDYLFGAICNSTSVGGVLTLDPSQVDMSDGLFEILLIRAPKDLFELTECITAIQKQQYNCRMITFRTAKNIRIQTDAEISWTLDGEMADGADEITVTNLHQAIKLVH